MEQSDIIPYKIIDLVHDNNELSPDSIDTLAIALGNFDGVHSAHQKLIASAKALANRHACACGLFFFDPPSSDFTSPTPQEHLTTLQEKITLIAKLGIDYAIIADFPAAKNISPSDFVNSLLKKQLHVCAVACGYNFRYGKNAFGTCDDLKTLFSPRDLMILPQQTMLINNEPLSISSTHIRNFLKDGKIDIVNEMLGYPYFLSAPVLHGKQLGRTIGIPTINQIFPDGKLILKHGIYACVCEIDGKEYYGVANVGTRPTVDFSKVPLVTCETHIFDFQEDLYGKIVITHFCHYLREEKKFASVKELKKAIENDIIQAKNFFAQ